MNDFLKRDEKYRVKYMRKHRMISVCLDRETDSDIIEWLERQHVISKSIKEALRAWVRR